MVTPSLLVRSPKVGHEKGIGAEPPGPERVTQDGHRLAAGRARVARPNETAYLGLGPEHGKPVTPTPTEPPPVRRADRQ